jgi:hypothetical protein
VLKTYGAAPYGAAIKKLEQQIKEKQQSVDEKIGVKVCVPCCTPGHRPRRRPRLTPLFRNQIPAWRHLTSGMSPPIANGCRKNNLFR